MTTVLILLVLIFPKHMTGAQVMALTQGSGQRYGATYSPRTAYGAGAVVEESDGNLYRAVAPGRGNPPATDKGRYWELWSVVNNVTLKVPNRFATIPDSLLYLKNARIGENVYVTIQVADGTYTYRSSVVLNHVFGARIRLLGNTQTPANCVLSFTGDTDGLVALNGHRFGLIDGFKVVGTWNGSTSPGFPGGVPARSKAAILARYGAFIRLGTHLETDRFYYGVEASQGSTVVADGVKVTNAGDGGFFSYSGSTIRANNAEASYCKDEGNNLGFGFIAEMGSVVYCNESFGHHNWRAGYFSNTNGSLFMIRGRLEDNRESGMLLSKGSVAEAIRCVAKRNGTFGYMVEENSFLFAGDAIAEENENGFLASTDSVISAPNSRAINNKTDGYRAYSFSKIYAVPSVSTGNGRSAYSPAPLVYDNEYSFIKIKN